MNSSDNEEEEEEEEEEKYEKSKPLESYDDYLPTDDNSVSVVGSSSSSDDINDGFVIIEENEPQYHQSKNKAPVEYNEASSSSSSRDDSSDDSSSSSSDEDDESDDAVEEEQNAHRADHNDSSSSDDENDDDDLQHLSLQERLEMKQDAGRNIKKKRAIQQERKNHALQVASERLHQQQTNKNTEHNNIKTKKKRSKHKPTEASSKRRDFYSRGAPTLDSSGIGVAVTAHIYKPRDPRIMGATSKSSAPNNDNYAFIQEVREQEITKLKKQIAVRKLAGRKGQRARKKLGLQQGSLQHDQEELARLLQEKASYERAQVDMAAKQAVKRKLKQQVADGKGVYYLKKREMKKLQLEAKYEELRKRGGDKAVDKALAKRRKKLKSKDTGYVIPKDA